MFCADLENRQKPTAKLWFLHRCVYAKTAPPMPFLPDESVYRFFSVQLLICLSGSAHCDETSFQYEPTESPFGTFGHTSR